MESPIITPTTKGETDTPISRENIVKTGLMNQEECDYIYDKALELFKFGQEMAGRAGFILVDTKYEFGRSCIDNEIILIDEVHTCDSSRYWIKDTYEENFSKELEPDKLDKDVVRDWVKSVCEPYTEDIPELPEEVIKKARDNYQYFYDKISNC